MELDLRRDVPRLRELLKEAISSYCRRHSGAATKVDHPPVTRVDLNYTFGMAEVPLISIHFDTRSTEPGHGWSHVHFAGCEYPRWNPARLHAEDGGSVSLRT